MHDVILEGQRLPGKGNEGGVQRKAIEEREEEEEVEEEWWIRAGVNRAVRGKEDQNKSEEQEGQNMIIAGTHKDKEDEGKGGGEAGGDSMERHGRREGERKRENERSSRTKGLRGGREREDD